MFESTLLTRQGERGGGGLTRPRIITILGNPGILGQGGGALGNSRIFSG